MDCDCYIMDRGDNTKVHKEDCSNSEKYDKAPSKDAEGNPVLYIDHDGNILCNNCAQDGMDSGELDPNATEWQVNWQGKALTCTGCNCYLESVY